MNLERECCDHCLGDANGNWLCSDCAAKRATREQRVGALSDQEIDAWLLMMERLFGKDFLQGDM